MALAGRRSQRRRRRWLFLALILTLVILAVNAAVSSRSSGPALRQAVGDAIGTQPGPTAVAELVNAGRAIAAGDQAYSLFVAAVPKQSTPMPPSQWITDDQAWSEPLLTTFVTTLRSSASLIPV